MTHFRFRRGSRRRGRTETGFEDRQIPNHFIRVQRGEALNDLGVGEVQQQLPRMLGAKHSLGEKRVERRFVALTGRQRLQAGVILRPVGTDRFRIGDRLIRAGHEAWVGGFGFIETLGKLGRVLLQRFPLGLVGRALLLGLSFLPQFVSTSQGDVEWQLGLLGLLFTAQAVALFGLLGWFSGSVGGWLNRRPGVGRWLDWLAGTVFIGLGARMIVAR